MSSNSPIRPGASGDFRASVSQVRRARLVRDTTSSPPRNTAAVDRFALRSGEMYRISYAIGGTPQRRVSRSIAVFGGETERRSWGGEVVTCLDFSLPHGRTLSLLAEQLVDARAAELNEHGQWVLAEESGAKRKRSGRRAMALRPNPA